MATERLPRRVQGMREKLVVEDRVGRGAYTDIIEECLKYLQQEGIAATLDMARLEIDIYTERNQTCHSEGGSPKCAQDPTALDGAAAKDIANLDQLLDDGQVSIRQKLAQLMHFYRDSAKRFGMDPDDRTEVRHRETSPELPPTEDASDAFDLRGFSALSPVNPRSGSPSKGTIPESSTSATPRPSASPVTSTVEEQGPRASNGIREVIAKFESKGMEKASQAIEKPRKRGRWG